MPNKKNNGFNRLFMPKEQRILVNLKLPDDARSIIGRLNGNLLISSKQPDHLYSLAPTGKLKRKNLPGYWLNKPATKPHFHLAVDSSFLLIVSRDTPLVVSYDPAYRKLAEIRRQLPSYIYALYVGNGKMVSQQYTDGGKRFRLINLLTDDRLSDADVSSDHIRLSKGLESDGQLIFDRISKNIAYMHYYQNRIHILDTNASYAHSFKTIDTITNSLQGRTNGPILFTNQKSCFFNGTIYVSSNLKADNETRKQYREHIPVDTYDASTGIYSGSFYLPLVDNSLIKSMQMIAPGKLAILYHSNRFLIVENQS